MYCNEIIFINPFSILYKFEHSLFFFFLFKFNNSQQTHEENKIMPIMSKSKSILLVDDEPDIVNLFTDLLNREDYEVIGFTNPEQALEHYKTNFGQYGLVISDIRMPGMTGFDLLKNIKKIDATISIFFYVSV